MSQACPLLFRQIDGTITRINAVSVIVMLVLFLGTSQPLFLYVLAADFLIRLYASKAFSPVYRISLGVKTLLGLPSHMTDAGAKRLAAHFGFGFIVLLLVSHYMHYDILAFAVGTVFITCAALEAVFDYCVGCKIYFLFKKIYPEW